jgi:hypothetical protein
MMKLVICFIQFISHVEIRHALVGYQLVARPIPTHDNTNRINANMSASSFIRTHGPSIWTDEGSPCLRKCDQCDPYCRLLPSHNNNSVALARERSIPTKRPPLVSEVCSKFCGQRSAPWLAQRIPTAVI